MIDAVATNVTSVPVVMLHNVGGIDIVLGIGNIWSIVLIVRAVILVLVT